ncbi:hypothetical protein INT43_001729 [Umbelopsis isabellina]|uniref:Uncharacterized protein n=1 Tax=Mortierella isabellina TaxID=91625 RepID=A0A8H7UGC6_MORIS|nr:hypothetical protein INT43_001729 [Umbelopsis isabellina]
MAAQSGSTEHQSRVPDIEIGAFRALTKESSMSEIIDMVIHSRDDDAVKPNLAGLKGYLELDRDLKLLEAVIGSYGQTLPDDQAYSLFIHLMQS